MQYDNDNNGTSSKKITNKPDLSQLKRDLTMADSSHSFHVNQVQEWLDILYVEGSEVITTPKGKSKIQPKLVRKQVEWRYSVLTEPFLSTEDIFRILPRGSLDRDAAKQNQQILNYQFNEQMNKVKFIDSYTRTAVNEGTVVVKVGWNSQTKMVKELQRKWSYKAVVDEGIAAIIQEGIRIYQEDPNKIIGSNPSMAESVLKSVELGQLVLAEEKSAEMVEVEKVIVNQPDLTVCDYRNVIIDPTCNGNMEDAQFVIHSYDTDISSLRKAGVYENLDDIDLANVNTYSNADHTNLNEDETYTFDDKPRKKLTVFEYWGYWDLYGTGETCSFVASWVGNVMIRCEENPFPHKKIPFVVVPYLPTKNSVFGEADAELIADNQRTIGALTRGMIDTFANIASGQKGIAKGALDYSNKRKWEAGENFEYNQQQNFEGALWQAQFKELPQSAYNMLQMQNNEASSMTGIQPFASGIRGDEYGSTAAGVNTAVSAQAKREFGILRRLTEGLKDIAGMILAMNSEWLEDDEIIRITDEDFIAINRDNLVGSFDVKLTVSTQETDTLKASQLAFMLQTMGQTLPFEMTQLVLEDIADLNRMPSLAKKIREYKPEPTPQQQIELAKLQLELKEKELQLAKLQTESQLNAAKTREVNSKADLNNLEYVHEEKGVSHARDMEKQSAQAEANVKRDVMQMAMRQEETPKEETININE